MGAEIELCEISLHNLLRGASIDPVDFLDHADETLLAYTGRDVCRMILAGDSKWRSLVPEKAWAMAERHAQSSVV